jgi:cytochrome b involved in lipid metabolism
MRNKYVYLLILIVGVLVIVIASYFASRPKADEKIPQALTSVIPKAPTFAISEVAKHGNKQDCYIIVNDEVYDITKYFGKHPAGDRIMLEYCGQETSRAFAATHSNFAWNLLSDYYIGDIVN